MGFMILFQNEVLSIPASATGLYSNE